MNVAAAAAAPAASADPAAVCTDTYWNKWKTNNTNSNKAFDTKIS